MSSIHAGVTIPLVLSGTIVREECPLQGRLAIDSVVRITTSSRYSLQEVWVFPTKTSSAPVYLKY